MHDAAGVRVGQRPRHLAQNADHFRRPERAAVANAVGDGFPVHEAHGKERQPVDFIGAVDRRDVRMGELGGRAGLAQESLAGVRLPGDEGGQHLERDRPIQTDVARDSRRCPSRLDRARARWHIGRRALRAAYAVPRWWSWSEYYKGGPSTARRMRREWWREVCRSATFTPSASPLPSTAVALPACPAPQPRPHSRR